MTDEEKNEFLRQSFGNWSKSAKETAEIFENYRKAAVRLQASIESKEFYCLMTPCVWNVTNPN